MVGSMCRDVKMRIYTPSNTTYKNMTKCTMHALVGDKFVQKHVMKDIES